MSEEKDNCSSCSNMPAEFDELFKDRFTERDEDYKRTLNTTLPPPPCVENWYVRPKRSYDYTRGNERSRGRRRDRPSRWDGPDQTHFASRRDERRFNPYGGGQDRRQDRDHNRDHQRQWQGGQRDYNRDRNYR